MSRQNWDDVLYPSFRGAIRGEYYGVISQDFLDEECFNIACRAIAAFKFPKISTSYTVFYARWETVVIEGEEQEVLVEVSEDNPDGIPHAYFNNELSYAEIEVILAWMLVYWAQKQLSNSDNFEDMYTDVNIKTYSRANAVDKNLKLLDQYRQYARDVENRYSRVNSSGLPSLGDINNE